MADFTGSITLQSGSTGQYQLVLSVWENSYSVANNTSNVGWSLKVKSINSYYSYWGVAHTYKIVINGSTVYNTSKTMTVDKGATATVASGTTTVTHSNDGSKTISCSGSMSNPNYADSGVPKSGSCSGSLTLTTIPRATTPSLNLSGGTNFGNTITVKGTSASSSFSHKVYYNVNGESAWNYIGDVGSGSTSVSKSWTIPTSLMNKIPNGTTMQINMSLDTYSGSTKIGTKGVSFTATVPSNIVPSISSVSVSEAVSDIASTFGYYIQGKSKLAFSVSASGTYGSTIKSITGAVNNTGYTASSGKFTTNTIDKSGSISYTIKTTDSRGRTSSKTGSVTMVAYTNPTVSGTVQRATETYEVDEQEGIYALCNFSYNIYPLDDNNLKGFILQYRKSTDSAWTTLNEWTDEYSLSDYQYEAGNLLESTSAYNFRFGVMDYFNQNYIFSYATIEPTYTLINFRNTGKGIAFGGQSEGDDFTCNMDANINGNTAISGNSETGGWNVVNYGFYNMYKLSRQGVARGWYHLGTWVTNDKGGHGSSKNIEITIFSGDGYNAQPAQNSIIRFMGKKGYMSTESTSGAYSGTWWIEGKMQYYSSNVSTPQIEMRVSELGKCEIWFHSPWDYPDGRYEIKAYVDRKYDPNELPWINNGSVQTDAPTEGVSQTTWNITADMRGYPVGAVYQSTDSTNPNLLFGGTWTQFAQGRVLIGVGTGTDNHKGVSQTYTVNQTGGRYTHQLSTAELPAHNHSTSCFCKWGSGKSGTKINMDAVAGTTTSNQVYYAAQTSANTGSGTAHFNIQPYYAVYMWRRTG